MTRKRNRFDDVRRRFLATEENALFLTHELIVSPKRAGSINRTIANGYVSDGYRNGHLAVRAGGSAAVSDRRAKTFRVQQSIFIHTFFREFHVNDVNGRQRFYTETKIISSRMIDVLQ